MENIENHPAPRPSGPPPASEGASREELGEIKRKIKSGEYYLACKEGSRVKSSAWMKFKAVFDKATKKPVHAVCCIYCDDVKYYDNCTGTSALSRHKCKTASASAPAFEAVTPKVSATLEAKTAFRDSCIDFCATDLRPYNTIAGDGWKKVIQQAIDIGAQHGRVDAEHLIPDPTTVSRNTAQRAQFVRDKIMPEIREQIKAGNVAATTDLWKNKCTQTDYITCTVHFLNSDWELKSYVLFTVPVSAEEKTGANLKADLKKHFADLGVPEEDFVKIVFVTDGGSNIVKATEDNLRLYCIDHILNLVIRRAVTVKLEDLQIYGGPSTDIVSAAKAMLVEFGLRVTGGSELAKEIEPHIDKKRRPLKPLYEMLEILLNNYDEVREEMLDSDDGENPLCTKAALETILDIVKPVEQELLKRRVASDGHIPGVALAFINEHLSRSWEWETPLASDIVNYLKAQVSILEVVEQIEASKALVTHFKKGNSIFNLSSALKADIDTRWNGLLFMLRSVDSNFDEVSQAARERKQDKLIDRLDRNKIQAIIKFLDPVERASKRLEGDKYPTIHLAVVEYYKLRKHFQIQAEDSDMIKQLKRRAAKELDVKLKERLTQTHKIATFLCPSYRTLKMLDPAERALVRSDVRTACAAIELPVPDVNDTQETGSHSAKRRRIESSDSYYSSDDEWKESSEEEDSDEVERYIQAPKGDDSDLGKWWKEKERLYPRLSRLARKYLAIPATEASSERIFSDTGYTATGRRALLSPESLNDLIFLHRYYRQLNA